MEINRVRGVTYSNMNKLITALSKTSFLNLKFKYLENEEICQAVR